MPSRITIACEHCGAKLTLADDRKLGKKIKCPKCSEIFVAAADDDDIEDVVEEDDDEEVQPRRKTAAAATAGKNAKGKAGGKGKKKSGGNLGLIIGGSVAVGVLLIGGLVGVLFATGVIGGGGSKSDPNQIVMTPFTPSAPAGNSAPKSTTPAAANSTPAPSTTPAASTNSVAANNPMPTPTKADDSAATSAIPARSAMPETAKWLPADAEVIIHVRVADILTSPLVSELLKTNQLDGQLDGAIAPFGLKAADIESVTSGISQLNEVIQQGQQMQQALMTGQPPTATSRSQPPSLGVIKLKKPITYDVIQQIPSPIPMVKQQHSGKDYLEMADPTTGMKSGIWLASDSEVIIGDGASVKVAIEKGASSSTLPNFGFVDWTRQLTIAVAPKDLAALRSMKPPQGTGNPLFDQMINAFVEGTSGVSIGLAVKGGIDLEVEFGCVDEPKMEAIVKSLNDAIGLGKLQYDQSKQAIPPWAASLTDQLVANIAVKGENRVAVLSTNLPDSNQQQLVQLPAMIMTQVMMSAMMSGDTSSGDEVVFSANADTIKSVETIPAEAPENIKLTASLMEMPVMDFAQRGSTKSKAKKKERTISMTISAQWTGPKEECLLAAAGALKPRGGASSDGKKIKVAISKMPGLEVQPNELRPVTLAEFFEPAVQAGTLQLTIAEGETEPLKSVSGVCTLVTGRQVKQVTLPNVKALEGKEPEDEDLKAAGLQVKLVKEKSADGAEQIIVSVKEGFLLSSLEAIDGAGNTATGAMAATEKNERTQRLILFGDEIRQMQDIGVQAYLYTDLKTVTVPFTFENLEIPQAFEQPEAGNAPPQD